MLIVTDESTLSYQPDDDEVQESGMSKKNIATKIRIDKISYWSEKKKERKKDTRLYISA